MATEQPTSLSLLERLDQGPVICAEGYLFEFERRGYLQAGAFVPEEIAFGANNRSRVIRRSTRAYFRSSRSSLTATSGSSRKGQGGDDLEIVPWPGR